MRFLAFNIIRNVLALAFIKKLRKNETFADCYYYYVLCEGIDLWLKHESPPSLTITDPKFRFEFKNLMTYKNHYTDFCDKCECHSNCHILMMKSDYKNGLIKIRRLLEYIGNDEFNSVIINRNMKFIVVTSIFIKDNPKYIIFDSHENICQELTFNQTINYITEKKTYFGGIDFMVYATKDRINEKTFDKESQLYALAYILKNESSSSSSSLSDMFSSISFQ